MKKEELLKRLEKEGYLIGYGPYEYWREVPCVIHDDGSVTWLAETYVSMKSLGLNTNISYERAKEAIALKAYDCHENTIRGIKNEIEYQKILDEMKN